MPTPKKPAARAGNIRVAPKPAAAVPIPTPVPPAASPHPGPAPCYVLSATNALAVDLMRDFAKRASYAGCLPAYVAGLEAAAEGMREWQAAHPELVTRPE